MEIYTTETFGPPGNGAADLLLEVSHGATRTAHFTALRERLQGTFPADLVDFFHVNTDIGAPEVAREIGRRLGEETGLRVQFLRCLLPRTFVDCNRELIADPATGMTPAIPPYVRDTRDREWLRDLHQQYAEQARTAYEEVCSHGGLALNLHTYAPKSVAIDTIDDSIVAALRRAYEPENYVQWPMRPAIDLITRDGEDHFLAPPQLAQQVTHELQENGFEVTECATYKLFQATAGYWHSSRWPERILCLEVRRDLLTENFQPFEEMVIAPQLVDRVAGPVANALQQQFVTAP